MGKIKEPKNLTPRIEWLRNYYFEGTSRPWNNEYKVFTTGEAHDEIFNEITYYIVPETFTFFTPFVKGLVQGGRKIQVPKDFYQKSIAQRRAWFIREAMVNRVPADILPGDLLCGANFNLMASHCHTKAEAKARSKVVHSKAGLRNESIEFHDRGFGNCGATSGHLIPDYAMIVRYGFKEVGRRLEESYAKLTPEQKAGAEGAQLSAMREAAQMPCDLAAKFVKRLDELIASEKDKQRKAELVQMQANLRVVPFEGAQDFWQAVQSLWLTHMLVMTDENYPGPGVSFGRIDQYLYPFYKISKAGGMTDDFAKELLQCLWVHCNTAYDAQIKR